jgi:hypothetical protein
MNQHQYNQQNEQDAWDGIARQARPGKPQGLTRFSRVITTKRADTCAFCDARTVAGTDFAAVDADSKWIAVCGTCAASLTEQAKGLVRSIQARIAGKDIDSSAILMPTTENLSATLGGTASPALAFDTILALQVARSMVDDQVKVVDPRIATLRGLAGSATLGPWERSFTQSVLDQHDRGRDLSVKQWAIVDRIIASQSAPADAAPTVEVGVGLYLSESGAIHKLYMTQNDRLACKVLSVYSYNDGQDHSGSFEYVQGGVRIVRERVAAGTARLLTQDEAQAFGKLHGFCVNCARDLDDDRSLAVGYGPVCAGHFGWFYPTQAQAAEILARPTTA